MAEAQPHPSPAKLADSVLRNYRRYWTAPQCDVDQYLAVLREGRGTAHLRHVPGHNAWILHHSCLPSIDSFYTGVIRVAVFESEGVGLGLGQSSPEVTVNLCPHPDTLAWALQFTQKSAAVSAPLVFLLDFLVLLISSLFHRPGARHIQWQCPLTPPPPGGATLGRPPSASPSRGPTCRSPCCGPSPRSPVCRPTR